LVALGAWIVSFALPTIEMGGRGGPVPGVLAAYFAAMVAPVMYTLARAGQIAGVEVPFAIAMSLYFPLLALANVLVPLAFARRQRPPRPVHYSAAALATLVILVPWAMLWETLELASGDRVGLRIGYFVWAMSFWLVAVSTRTRGVTGERGDV
jgi:hypothetical protein